MILPDSAAEPPDDLLLFAPVTTAYRGANGWSSEVQRAFVAALARTGVVAAAARSVGRSARSAYQLRARAGEGSPFARAWAEAQDRGADRATGAAAALASEPRSVPVWYRGRCVGHRPLWENRLAFAALRALRERRAHENATSLLVQAMSLLDGRERCEGSPPDASR